LNTQSFTVGLADVEWGLVGSILANPTIGVPIARSEGCTPLHISQDDLRWMYSAAEIIVDSGRYPDEEHRTATLVLCKMALTHFGHWAPLADWSDESLVDFAMEHWGQPPITRECAAALVDVHERWADACDEHGPMYVPPPALGKLNIVRIGMILSKLSRLSGIPVDWLHHRFAEICHQQDTKITFSAPPKPIITNAPSSREVA